MNVFEKLKTIASIDKGTIEPLIVKLTTERINKVSYCRSINDYLSITQSDPYSFLLRPYFKRKSIGPSAPVVTAPCASVDYPDVDFTAKDNFTTVLARVDYFEDINQIMATINDCKGILDLFEIAPEQDRFLIGLYLLTRDYYIAATESGDTKIDFNTRLTTTFLPKVVDGVIDADSYAISDYVVSNSGQVVKNELKKVYKEMGIDHGRFDITCPGGVLRVVDNKYERVLAGNATTRLAKVYGLTNPSILAQVLIYELSVQINLEHDDVAYIGKDVLEMYAEQVKESIVC